jgi:hypothetical protein
LQLIATPEAFEGKVVRVRGYARIEHYGTADHLHREDWDRMLAKNGLWLTANDSASAASKEARVHDLYALMEGRFTAKRKGYRGLWCPAIEEVSRMEPLEPTKRRG